MYAFRNYTFYEGSQFLGTDYQLKEYFNEYQHEVTHFLKYIAKHIKYFSSFRNTY